MDPDEGIRELLLDASRSTAEDSSIHVVRAGALAGVASRTNRSAWYAPHSAGISRNGLKKTLMGWGQNDFRGKDTSERTQIAW